MSALGGLKTLLQAPCMACQVQVFDKLSSIIQQSFLNFLSRAPRFWDGLESYAPANVAFCPAGLFTSCKFGSIPNVHDYILGNYRGGAPSDAVSQTPVGDLGKGPQVFFNPNTGICNVLSVANPQSGDKGVLNQAVLFHEALHGYTGLFDWNPLSVNGSLESKLLGVTSEVQSVQITYYLEGHVIFGQGATACAN